MDKILSGESGGRKTKEDSCCLRWNLKLFWNFSSTKKTGDEMYSIGTLTSFDNEIIDESDDEELMVRKEATEPEKDSLDNCIININYLPKPIEDNTICKKCTKAKEIDI
eukprot:319866-Ditylum_brightwellii.AAC.1